MERILPLLKFNLIGKKKVVFFIALSFLLASFPSRATHIVGGEFAITWNSGNSFHIKLNFYRDCNAGNADFDASVSIGIYDLVTNVQQQCVTISSFTRTSITLGNACYTPSGLCVERGTFETDVTIPNNSNGYYVSWGRCCRNGIITNLGSPGSAGNEWYAEIPDPALHNSTPTFDAYPAAYWCAGQTNISDLSASDADGDSLVYSIVTPLNGNTNTGTVISSCSDPGPYSNVSYASPYTGAAPLGPTSNIYINAANGFLTVYPANIGVFVICVLVKEYRKSDGKYLGQVRRDIQYAVLACTAMAAYPDTTVCSSGSIVQMNANGGTSYNWSPSTGLSNPNISNPVATPSTSTTYTVTVTTAGGCTATTTVAISVNGKPTVTASNASVCSGSSVTLTAGGANTYTWSPGTGLSSTTGTSVNASPATNQTYTITGTDVYGCTNTKTVSVTITASGPTANATTPSPICTGSSASISASGGGTYSWSPGGATTSSISVSPSSTSTYTVTVGNGSGCTATATSTVTVNPSPMAGVSGVTGSICTGSSTIISASGGTSYSWSPGGATTSSISVSPTSNTTYSVIVGNASGCTATATSAITVNSSASAGVSGVSGVCNGVSTTLTGTGGGIYVWSPGGATTSSISVTAGTYTVTVTSGCGTATATATVTNSASPTAGVSGVTGTICNGSSTIFTGSGGGTYLWSPGGATTSSISVSAAGPYTVTVTGSGGCTATATLPLTVNTVTNTITAPVTFCVGGSTSLTACCGSSYLWSPGTGLSGTTGTTVSANPTNTTTYTVTITDSSGCTATASTTVYVNANPTAPIITHSAGWDTLFCNPSTYNSYQWYRNNIILTGKTSDTLVIGIDNATYNVLVTNASGCTDTASSSQSRLLPIELISFDAVYNGKSVDVDWSTASEINNDYFTVERTKDGTDFTPVVKVKGAGQSNSLLYYHAIDENPLFGVSAYRLRQTDFDGKYQFSRMVAVTVQSGNKIEILSLNNTSGENILQYFISNSSGKPFNVEVTDKTGRLIISKVSSEKVGTINLSDFAHGIYIFHVFDSDGSSLKQFVY